MESFVPVKKQLKCKSQSGGLLMVIIEWLWLLLHELWVDFCTKKDWFADSSLLFPLELRLLWTHRVLPIILQFLNIFGCPYLGISHSGCPPVFQK